MERIPKHNGDAVIYFCGYPVNAGPLKNFVAVPCGKPATPGCAFCDEHGELFDAESRRQRLTEQDIVDRAEHHRRRARMWLVLGLFCAVALIALWLPVHSWLHAHLELLLGILIGALLQSPGWLRDRWRWMKHFSWQ